MFKFLRLVLLCGPRILWDYFAWMLRYSRHPERYPFEVRYAAARKLIVKTIKRFRLNMQVEGLEYLNSQKGPFVLVANHQSMMDVLVLVAISERPLTFISNAFVPLDSMPSALQTFAMWNPVSTMVAAVRELFGNSGAPLENPSWPMEHPVVASAITISLLLAVMVPLALHRFRSRTSD